MYLQETDAKWNKVELKHSVAPCGVCVCVDAGVSRLSEPLFSPNKQPSVSPSARSLALIDGRQTKATDTRWLYSVPSHTDPLQPRRNQHTDRQADRQTDRKTGRHTERQTYRQTGIHTDRYFKYNTNNCDEESLSLCRHRASSNSGGLEEIFKTLSCINSSDRSGVRTLIY